MTSSKNHTAIILILLQFFKKIPLSAKFFSSKLQLSAEFFLPELQLSAEFRLFYSMWQKFREVYLPECGLPACNFQMNSRRICNLFFRAVQIDSVGAFPFLSENVLIVSNAFAPVDFAAVRTGEIILVSDHSVVVGVFRIIKNAIITMFTGFPIQKIEGTVTAS